MQNWDHVASSGAKEQYTKRLISTLSLNKGLEFRLEAELSEYDVFVFRAVLIYQLRFLYFLARTILKNFKMKLFYLSFLLLFALVFAQDEVTIEPPQSRCYSGSIENGTGEILERECDFRMVRPISVHCDGETANDTLDFYILLLPFWLLCYRNELLRRTT